MTGPTFQPGDEIEWLDDEPRDGGPPRWRPGTIADVRYEVRTDVAGEWFSLPLAAIRSAPRLPLEGIES